MIPQWIKCIFWHHEYYVIDQLSDYSRKLGCKACLKIFGMNDDARVVVRWDAGFEDFYKSLNAMNLGACKMTWCLRCGKQNTNIHTCTPNESCRIGILEGLNLAKKQIDIARQKAVNHESEEYYGFLFAVEYIDKLISNLINEYNGK